MQWNSLKRDIFLLSCASVLVFIYVVVGGGNFALDDGWIHQTYARNLAAAGEWAFIPGEPSAASTSPLYTVLLSIGYRLNLDYRFWTHGLGVLALALTGILGARLANFLLPNHKNAPLITGLALLLTWHHIWAAASGMETMLFGMLTLLLIFLAWSHPLLHPQISSPSRIIGHGGIFGICAALTTLARPEGILLAGLAGLLLLLACVRHFAWQFSLWTLSSLVGFGIFIAPYLLLNLQLTGGVLPDTAAAKFEQHAILLALPYPVRVWQLFLAIIAGGQVLLLPGIVYFVVYSGQVNRSASPQFSPSVGSSASPQFNPRYWLSLLPLFWAFALILLYAARLPASYQHGRYVLPALPSLVFVGVVGILAWMQNTTPRKSSALLRRVLGRVWAIATLLVYALFAFVTGIQVYSTDVAIINGEMVTAAHWIRDNIPTDELLAIHDIGAVGYFAPRPLIDVAGLVTPELIPLLGQPEAIWNYLQEQNARYLLAFPDQIPGRNPTDSRLCPLYTTHAEITRRVGEQNMTLYRLVWDEPCNNPASS